MGSSLNNNGSIPIPGISGFSGPGISGFSGFNGFGQLSTNAVLSTGVTNDFVLGGSNIITCSTQYGITTILTGIVPAGSFAQKVTLINNGTGDIRIPHQSGSAVANQISISKSVSDTVIVGPGGVIDLVYDITSTKWRIVNVPESTINGYIAACDGARFDTVMARTSAGPFEFFEDQYIVLSYNNTISAKTVSGTINIVTFGMESGSTQAAVPVAADADFVPKTGSGTLTTTYQTINGGVSTDYDDISWFYMVLLGSPIRYRITVMGGFEAGLIVERWNYVGMTENQKIIII